MNDRRSRCPVCQPCSASRWWQARAAPREGGVVWNAEADPEQGRERAQQALGLPPRTTKGQAQQVPGLDRHIRLVARSPSLARAGRVPGRECLRGDPDRKAAPLLERPVVRRPIRHSVARPRDLVSARLISLVGHRPSREREDGPIRPTQAEGRNFAPTPRRGIIGHWSVEPRPPTCPSAGVHVAHAPW